MNNKQRPIGVNKATTSIVKKAFPIFLKLDIDDVSIELL